MKTKIKKQKKHKGMRDLNHGDFKSIGDDLSRRFDDDAWPEVAQRLSKPKRSRALAKRLGAGKKSPLIWLLTEASHDEAAENRINRWYKTINRPAADSANKRPDAVRLVSALQEVAGQPNRPALPLIALGCAHMINAAADQSSSYFDWSSLVDRLLDLSKTSEFEEAGDRRSWVVQTLNVELPLTLAYQLPEFVPPGIAKSAVKKMADKITELLDLDGWPDSGCLPLFGPLVASWARSHAITASLGLKLESEAASQIEWLVRQFLRLLRRDRTLMFGGLEANQLTDECLHLVLDLSKDLEDRKLAKRVTVEPAKAKINCRLPDESSISEWSESGILQSGWYRGSPKVGFDYADRSFRMEIGADVTLIAGKAMPTIEFNGSAAIPLDSFELVCNEHDDDLDYVELQMDLSESLTLTRQLILSRDEQFLMIADCVVATSPGKIEYCCDWPLAPEIQVMPETETREVYLRTQKIQSLVLPLALPEWKVERFDGRFETVGNLLRMTHSATGAGLYSPLFFDLNPRRSKNRRTWRRLTVAENLQNVPADVAAAFRIQLHKQQWFFYRVVSTKANRTFFGENFNGEFVFNRFDRKGKVTQLVGID